MGINNMGIYNSGNRKSTIGNGEKFIDKTGHVGLIIRMYFFCYTKH